MKRSLLLYIGLMVPMIGWCQLNLNNLNLNNSAFEYYSPTIDVGGTTSLIIGSGNYNLKAATSIHISTNTHIGTNNASATGKFNASICNGQLDAVILEPADLNAVTKFSKVEIGINFPDIDTRVSNFLNGVGGYKKPGSPEYATAFANGTIINPYDPQHISVDVVLFRPSSPNNNGIIRYGFYYRDVTINNTNTNWNPPAYADKEWRVRFAPDETGVWTGFANIYVGGVLVEARKAFSFNVVNSSNKGYIQKGPNPKYLQYSGSGGTYIPVGNQFAGIPSTEISGCTGVPNCSFPGDHRLGFKVIADMNKFVNALAYTPTAGNATRIIMSPWNFQIEYERLGNYDTRQIEMATLDNFINLLEQKNVKLTLAETSNGLNHSPDWQSPDGSFKDGWDGNPYNGSISSQTAYPNYQYKGLAGVYTIDDLLNPANPSYATFIQLQKNRWRYIESRWGYSTAVSTYELMNELDVITRKEWSPSKNEFIDVDDYWQHAGGSREPRFAAWLTTMAQYLKQDLKTKHLVTASYVGLNDYNLFKVPNLGPMVSQIFSSPYVDVVSAHGYASAEFMQRMYFNHLPAANPAYPTKPFCYNEMDDAVYYVTDACTDIQIHNYTWSGMFSGSMGPGLTWSSDHYLTGNTPLYGVTNSYTGEYEKNYPALNSFIGQIDFQNTAYSSYSSLGATPAHEVFYMVDLAKQRAFGWAHNRSFNVFTNQASCLSNYNQFHTIQDFMNTPDSDPDADRPYYFRDNAPQTPGPAQGGTGMFYNNDNYVTEFGTAYAPVGKAATSVSIPNLLPNTTYAVVWVWTWGTNGGQDASGYTQLKTSNANGIINCNIPPTGNVGGTLYPGDWAFKIIKTGNGPTTSINEDKINKLTVSPNPSTDIFVIKGVEGEAHEKALIKVFDVSGRLIIDEQVADIENYQVDLKNNDNGIYILKIMIKDKLSVIKLIKNKN
jgi:hypothetical protein